MNDLISRQDAIDAIERTEWYHQAPDGTMVHGANSALHQAWYKEQDVYKALENVPTAQRWIPVTEQLPNCNGIYIVTRIMSDGFECRNIVDACYFDGSDSWHDDTRVNHGRKYLTDVVAWMPLPEPYREDGDT